LDSWDVCDQACQNLFWRSPHACDMVRKWSRARGEFVRRAGFSLLASLATRRRDLPAAYWTEALALVEEAATDDRNYVRKAVNWALRGIGARNPETRAAAVVTAQRLKQTDSRAARWIGADALRELES
jgi:3-methyladenine DNA glycosylase AlkD